MVHLKRLLCLVAIFAVTGCYTYQPVRPGDAVLDTRVRATVTPRQAAELAPVMRSVTSSVQGRLVQRSGEEILLEVPIYGSTPGMSSNALRNRVAIPMGELVSLESRNFSALRTGVVIGALVAAIGTTWAVVSGGDDDIGEKPGTGVDNSIISVFRIPFGIFR